MSHRGAPERSDRVAVAIHWASAASIARAFVSGDPAAGICAHAPRIPHGAGARLLLALPVLHAGAALHHHFVRRDGLMRRIRFGA